MATASRDLTASSIFGFNDKVALVTGGGTGIGLMMATALAQNGGTVYIASRRKEVVEKSAKEFNAGQSSGKLVPLQLDITSKESIKSAVETIRSSHGHLDTLINNSGQVGPSSRWMKDPNSEERKTPGAMGDALFKEDPEAWSSLYQTNVQGVFFVSTAFLGLLEEGSKKSGQAFSSSIINIGSISGHTKLAQAHFAYNSSKAAVHSLTYSLSAEFALKGAHVRVNAIAPGLFPSEMTDKEGGEFSAEETTKYSGALIPVPAGRSGRAQEIAGTALYLASAAGQYTNGQVIAVDGGWEAVNP